MGRNDGTDLKKMTSSRNKYKILILGSKNQLWVYKMAKTTFHGKKKDSVILVLYKVTIKQSSKMLAPNAYTKLH